MDRYSFAILFGCSLVLVFSTGTNALALTFVDQLTQLTDKYKEIQKVLVEKDTGKLEEKVNRLEEKVSQLKHKVEHLEFLLIAKNQKKQRVIKDVKSIEMENKPTAMDGGVFRTCQEMYDQVPTLVSGWYWIDPDGQASGDSAIYVYCDVVSGEATTVISHDSEAKIKAASCFEPGCYSRKINYNASMNQMIALSTLSTECHQHHRYDCIDAPFEFDDVQYSWWNDRNDNPQYFWAGGATADHICECEIDGRCVNANKKCNCDSGLRTPFFDSGFIQAKEFLPITQLNFGRTIGSGQHTLGRFECTGKVTNYMPRSCLDLRQIGHTLNGIYSVMGSKFVETIYCDFTKSTTESDLQTFIGYVDIKTSPVYFYVQRKNNHDDGGRIPYDIVRLNLGGAMDSETGIFTAPRAGIYSFSFSGVAYMERAITDGYYMLALVHNRRVGSNIYQHEQIGKGRTFFDTGKNYQTLSLQSMLQLNKDDEVWLENSGIDRQARLEGGGDASYIHFTGVLLQEDF